MTSNTTKPLSENEKAGAAERVREVAGNAQEKVSAAATSAVDAAKERPYAAAGIAVGVAAAVAGAAFGVSKLKGDAPEPRSGGAAKTSKK